MQRKIKSWIVKNVEYEVGNKRKYSEKAKKGHQLFRDLNFFGKVGD